MASRRFSRRQDHNNIPHNSSRSRPTRQIRELAPPSYEDIIKNVEAEEAVRRASREEDKCLTFEWLVFYLLGNLIFPILVIIFHGYHQSMDVAAQFEFCKTSPWRILATENLLRKSYCRLDLDNIALTLKSILAFLHECMFSHYCRSSILPWTSTFANDKIPLRFQGFCEARFLCSNHHPNCEADERFPLQYSCRLYRDRGSKLRKIEFTAGQSNLGIARFCPFAESHFSRAEPHVKSRRKSCRC